MECGKAFWKCGKMDRYTTLDVWNRKIMGKIPYTNLKIGAGVILGTKYTLGRIITIYVEGPYFLSDGSGPARNPQKKIKKKT